MPYLNTETHRSMQNGYIFYHSLLNDDIPGHKQLYNSVRGRVNSYTNNPEEQYPQIGAQLITMANNELKKEAEVLSKAFNVTIPTSIINENTYLEITEAWNSVMHLKSVLERTLYRINNLKGEVSIFNQLPWYVAKSIKERASIITQNVANASNQDIALKRELEECIVYALQLMFVEAKNVAFASKGYAAEIGAYKELFEYLQSAGTSNYIIQAIYKNLKLDSITDWILPKINSRWGFTAKTITDVQRKANLCVDNRTGGRDFETLSEWEETYVMNLIAQGLGEGTKSTGYSITGHNIGGLKGRPDNVFVVSADVNTQSIEDELKREDNFKNRNEAIKYFTNLTAQLKDMEKVYIIYESDKSYAAKASGINKFEGAKALTIDGLETILKELGMYSTDLVGLVKNTMTGAVADDQKGALEIALASQIAGVLFDDVRYIGQSFGQSGGNAVHVFNLSGITVPLSVFLFKLGDAFNSVSVKNISSMASVSIQSGSIAHPYDVSAHSYENSFNGNRWENQKEEANKIKIGIKFWGNFLDFVSGLKI